LDVAYAYNVVFSMKNVLEFDSLELKFDARSILSGVYVKCEQGEVVGILGRNGSGKSSLMKIVFGTLIPDHKSIRINGAQLPGNHIKQRKIAYLPQHSLIPPHVSIRKAIKLFGIEETTILAQFPEINEFLLLKPDAVSGGYRRIIESLLILKSHALFCILDEPFSGLMPIHVEKMKNIILSEKANKGIIITDHLYRDVMTLTDRLYLLTNGATYLITNEEELISRGYVTAL
jgi:ABC-type multidrug transport system ATPase subunit